MIVITALLLGALATGLPRDTTPATPRALDTAVAAPDVSRDTLRRRARAVDVSDAYALRLRLHRYGSYTLVPLFALQTVAGNQLYQSGGSTPDWAKSLHRVGAGGLGALFGLNTVTGLWNLWESRDVAPGRTRRLLHSGLMLASDAGFAYAGIKLGPEATRSLDKRIEHRRLAYISMSGALLGYATMLVGDR